MNKDHRDQLIGKAISLAERLQTRANELQTPAEKAEQMQLDRMCQSPEGNPGNPSYGWYS